MVAKLMSVACIAALLVLGTATEAAAYTDPGSGAMLWQLIVAAFIAGGFYFRKVLGFFRQRPPRDQ